MCEKWGQQFQPFQRSAIFSRLKLFEKTTLLKVKLRQVSIELSAAQQ